MYIRLYVLCVYVKRLIPFKNDLNEYNIAFDDKNKMKNYQNDISSFDAV